MTTSERHHLVPKGLAAIRVLVATASVIVLAGCADDSPGSASPDPQPAASSSPRPSATDVPTASVPPDPRSLGDYSRKTRRFTPETFVVPFTIEVPGGWSVTERSSTITQLWRGRNEELSNAEVTLTMDVDGTAAEVLAAYTEALAGSESSPVRRGRYGPYVVREIDVRAVQEGLPGGYRLPPEGQATIVVFDVDGRGVTAILDGFAEVEPPRQVVRSMRAMERVLETIRFTRR